MKKETKKKFMRKCLFTLLFLGGLSFSFSAQAATQIYRSVGPGNTADLNINHRTVAISENVAIFSSAMPDNVGVGDVLQYDCGEGLTIAFISARTDDRTYTVQSPSIGLAASVGPGTSVNVYRAYTSLANAEAGIENTAFDSTVANFDDWTVGGDATANDLGNDLVAGDLQWNIACYGDAEDDVSLSVVLVSGWTTDDTRYIKVFTPNSTTQAGISQRHAGVWGETGKYTLAVHSIEGDDPTDPPINIAGQNVWLEGLQILDDNLTSGGSVIGVSLANISGLTRISNCIIKSPVDAFTNFAIMATGIETGTYKIWNNIISGFSEGGIYFDGDDNTLYAYNNTIYGTFIAWEGSDVCFNVVSGTVVAKNNIVQNCSAGYSGIFDATSDYNLSDFDDAPGDNSTILETLSFTDLTLDNENFHLVVADSEAIDAGTDLSADPHLNFSTDIDGGTRSGSWDYGADESPFITEPGDEIAPAEPLGLAVN